MTEFTIPCDTFVRLSNLMDNFHEEADEWFHAIRIDNGLAIASNRYYMAIENIGGNTGTVHIVADPVLIAKCREEAKFNGALTITVNEPLRYAVAKTTFGYIHPGNCAVWSDKPNLLATWRTIAARVRDPVMANNGGMYINADHLALLIATSPSGQVYFEENIDASGARPILVRDCTDFNWIGLFHPFKTTRQTYDGATLPNWVVL